MIHYSLLETFLGHFWRSATKQFYIKREVTKIMGICFAFYVCVKILLLEPANRANNSNLSVTLQHTEQAVKGGKEVICPAFGPCHRGDSDDDFLASGWFGAGGCFREALL